MVRGLVKWLHAAVGGSELNGQRVCRSCCMTSRSCSRTATDGRWSWPQTSSQRWVPACRHVLRSYADWDTAEHTLRLQAMYR